MKLLVCSDSHGNLEDLRQAVEREQPDQVLHLGDVVWDGQRLREVYPGLVLEQVRGNCDGYGDGFPEEKELLVGGKRIWMLHGHTYRVKLGVSLVAEEARVRGVDAVVFGHTHQPLCYLDGNLWVMNPGTISGFPKATYGLIELKDGSINCRTAEIK